MSASLSIGLAFGVLLRRIEPRPGDTEVYLSHEKTVKRRLETVFQSNRLIRIGSYSRESAIRYTSDVDLMLVLKRDEARWGGRMMSSTTVLNRVRNQLSARYWQTDVGRDGQAIVVRFRGNQYPVDVVPAVYSHHGNITNFDGSVKNYPIFLIPDGDGDWLETSPLAHNKYIRDANAASGGKLKRTAKLIKYWRRCRQPHIPLNSFYTELLLAKEDICVGAKSYALCLNNSLAELANRACRQLQDPLGISGLIKAAYTDRMQEQSADAALASAQRAYNAVMAERAGDLREAVRLWEIVFNHKFRRGA
jgi:Second Messenger Oligonucleotide or Dinucleotide Synthetase domain